MTVTAPSSADAERRRPEVERLPASEEGSPLTRLRWTLRDGMAVARRYLRHYRRQPQLVVFSTIQPVMFVLLFRYVFSGLGEVLPPGVDYATYLIPGILVQSVVFGATQAAVGLAEDLKGGVIDRFKSLPMARSAVLVGRTTADLTRATFVAVLMAVVGLLVGASFPNGLLGAAGAVAIVVAMGYALAWVFCFIGLAAKGTETAQAAGFVAVFPLVFASSVFTSPETFPDWLRAFSDVNPISNVADAARALAIGPDRLGPIVESTAEPVLTSLAWVVGILAVFVPLSVRRYTRSA